MVRIVNSKTHRDDLINWCEDEAERRRPTSLGDCNFLHAIAELIRPVSPAIPITEMDE